VVDLEVVVELDVARPTITERRLHHVQRAPADQCDMRND